MKNELRKTVLVNLPLLLMVLLISFIFSDGSHIDIMAFLGFGFLLVALINLVIGIIVLLVGIITNQVSTRAFAASMLVVAGISLLCSLGFCTASFRHL